MPYPTIALFTTPREFPFEVNRGDPMKIKGFVSAVAALMLISPFASAGDPVQM
tara:strand:+ start:606 stop:764 length:159 start_codon:yes stop_codon:yes gene_type:complete